MSSSREISQHIDKLLFISRLQEQENSFKKFTDGKGVLPSGGGIIGHGGGLGRGGGLDTGGFYQRKFAVRQQMLEDEVKYSVEMKDGIPESQAIVGSEEAVDIVQIQGTTSQPWKTQKKQTEDVTAPISGGKSVSELIKGLKKKEFGSQTRTKAVIVVKDGSNEVLKYKSLGDLARTTKMSKYSLINKFKPKNVGDNVHSSKLGGTLVFVNKSDLVNF
jgi:hypothetical protein